MSTALGANTIGGAQRKRAPYDAASGGYGIRQEFVNAGLKNEDIGFDGDWVTYKGNKMIKPKANVNGTTYADRGDIQNAISTAYRNDNRNLVRVNEYNNGYGPTGAVGWDAATRDVTVGGESIPYAYIDDDGNAWADAGVLDAAYQRLAKRNGIKNPDDILSQYSNEVSGAQREAASAAARMKNWSMTSDDMRRDAAFRAYEDLYSQEAMRSYNDALARTATQNGGNLSSAALAAAGAGQRYHLSQMAAQIPQLYNMAYERYIKGEQANIDNQRDIMTHALNQFNARYDINRDRVSDYNSAVEAERTRRKDEMDRLDWQQEYNQTAWDNAMKNARARGYYTDEEAALVGADKGRSPYEADVEQERRLWDDIGRRKAQEGYSDQFGYLIKPQQELEQKNRLEEIAQQYANNVGLENVKGANNLALADKNNAADLERARISSDLSRYEGDADRRLKAEQAYIDAMAAYDKLAASSSTMPDFGGETPEEKAASRENYSNSIKQRLQDWLDGAPLK